MEAIRRDPQLTARFLLLGGVLGPVLFVVTILVEGATRPGYDPVSQFISVLGLGDGGWVQAVNFIVSGLLITGFGIELGRAPRRDLHRATARLLIATGVALAVCGVFPADPQLGYPHWISAAEVANPSMHARIHLAAGFAATGTYALAVLGEVRRLAGTGAMLGAAYGLASVGLMIACFLVSLVLEPPGGPLPVAGLLQRVGIIGGLQWLVWFAAASIRIRPKGAWRARGSRKADWARQGD